MTRTSAATTASSSGLFPKKGARLVDGMNDRPREGEEVDGRQLKLEPGVIAPQGASRALHRHQHERCIQIHERIRARICRPDLQTRSPPVRGDHRVGAERDAGRGTGESPVDQSGAERETHDAEHGLQPATGRFGDGAWRDEPVSHGGDGLHAEEELVEKARKRRSLRRSLEPRGADDEVEDGEDDAHGEKRGEHDAKNGTLKRPMEELVEVESAQPRPAPGGHLTSRPC